MDPSLTRSALNRSDEARVHVQRLGRCSARPLSNHGKDAGISYQLASCSQQACRNCCCCCSCTRTWWLSRISCIVVICCPTGIGLCGDWQRRTGWFVAWCRPVAGRAGRTQRPGKKWRVRSGRNGLADADWGVGNQRLQASAATVLTASGADQPSSRRVCARGRRRRRGVWQDGRRAPRRRGGEGSNFVDDM